MENGHPGAMLAGHDPLGSDIYFSKNWSSNHWHVVVELPPPVAKVLQLIVGEGGGLLA